MRAEESAAHSGLDREPGDFFPLAIGNAWTYAIVDTEQIISFTGIVRVQIDRADTWSRTIECRVDPDGEEWFVGHVRNRIGFANPYSTWQLLRQDRDGLHTLPLQQRTDPCAGSVTIDPFYVQRTLPHPLRPGATWTIGRMRGFSVPLVGTVEAHEVITLPIGRFPAVRIAVRGGNVYPGLARYEWYGRDGFLASEIRGEIPALDNNGVHIGTLRVHHSTRVTEIAAEGGVSGAPMTQALQPTRRSRPDWRRR